MSKCMECQFLLPVPRDAGDDQRHQDLIGCICGFWGEGFHVLPRPAHRVRHQGESSA